jgi:phospholipase C
MLGLLLGGCTSPPPGRAAAGTASLSPQQPGTNSPATPAHAGLDHVVVIVEENKPSSMIVGNPDAQYINSLAAEYTLATGYQAVTHPSLPNYLALTSGSTAGITDDCNPPGGSCTAAVASIADRIQGSGRSWKMYAEGMPAPCIPENSGRYAVKHNPFLYYPAVTADHSSCTRHDVPFTQFAGDLSGKSTLPDYSFISPDLCNDMHDCSVATGDAWLAAEVPRILASPAFTQQNSLLAITWDEGTGVDNTVSAILAGPAAKKGHTSSTAYTHYSLLRTIELAWGLPALTTDDANATPLTDLLN